MERKKKNCTICNEHKYIFSKKRCLECSKIDYAKKSELNKEKKAIPKVTEKTKLKNKEKSDIRSVYFNFHISRCKRSEQSGVLIYEPNRSNICHLFSKSKHPSVQSHLDNYVYLTIQEHAHFDKLLFENDFKSLEKEFSNCWSKVINRMKVVRQFCNEKTKFLMRFDDYLINLEI